MNNDPEMQKTIVQVRNLKKYFEVKEGGLIRKKISQIKAVENVNFDIKRGETFGLVGESGCGKSTLGRTILRLLEATEGEVFFEGQNVFNLTKSQLRKLRRDMQIIFQDPFASLNPRMKVGQIVGESVKYHGLAKGKALNEWIASTLIKCGLASYHINRYPHEFSGGQRQRIGIARALALNPKFIVADEPVSALDVSIQSQILNLLEDLQEEFGLTYLFISHDLSVVKHISDRIGVMYLGSLVELAGKEHLYDMPLHPYTKALLSAIPKTNPKQKKDRIILTGDIPSPAHPPSGCRFRTRCIYAKDICSEAIPELKEMDRGHFVACHRVKEIH